MSCSGGMTPIKRRRWRKWAGLMPEAATRAADAVLALVPPTDKKKGLVNKARRFVDGLAHAPPSIAQYRWMTFLGADAKARLYTPAFRGARVRRSLSAGQRSAGPNRSLRLVEPPTVRRSVDLSADDILVKVDRMRMATSLETRAPFLDARVMELAFSMPGDLKIRGGRAKDILKQALRGLVPDRILDRKKEGFSIPMKQWLKRELKPLMERLLAPERLAARGLIEPAKTRRLIDEHCAGCANHAHVLFSLMVFERWAEEFAL